MELGYTKRLYILAFDHRGSFQKKMFGISGEPNEEETARIADAKRVIFEGFQRAGAEGAPKESAGLLVDEQFGADIARTASAEGFLFAMPVEKSGQDEFDFQYGADYAKHIEGFDPSFVKVLVRHNVEGDPEMNVRQEARLKELSDRLHAHDRTFLFELLVAAEPHQLEAVGGDADRYDKETRPALMVQSIRALQEAGIEPDIWKIEGIDARDDCQRISEQVRSGGRDHVACVVLGRGANEDAVIHWLRTGAGVPGYIGFAIGRTIWWDAVKAYLAGDIDRGTAAKTIAENYRKMIDVYAEAAGS
jgi:myo-inositol catabolism protein IolC